MEVETLVGWMLRRREEMTRTAATDGLVRHTVQYLKRKFKVRTECAIANSDPNEILLPDFRKNLRNV